MVFGVLSTVNVMFGVLDADRSTLFGDLENWLKWLLFRPDTIQVGRAERHDVTVVSIYFKFDWSKHSVQKYREWQLKYFQSVSAAPVVIYTDRASMGELLEMATMTEHPKTFFVFDEIWDVTRMIEWDRKRRYVRNYQTVQRSLDPEAHYHSPELYAVWNAKVFLMNKATFRNVYKSRFFLYTDLGAFRSAVHANWPDVEHLVKLRGELRDRMLFGRVSSFIIDPYDSTSNHVEGTFFAGSLRAVRRYYSQFYAVHDELLERNEFVGKDQKIMNIAAVERSPERSCLLWAPELLSECLPSVDIWFFYQLYFAAQQQDESAANNRTRFYASKDAITCDGSSERIAIPRYFQCDDRSEKSGGKPGQPNVTTPI